MRAAVSSRKGAAVRLVWLGGTRLIVVSVLIAALVRFFNDPEGFALFSQSAAIRSVVMASFITLAMGALGLYQVHIRYTRTDVTLRLLLAFALGAIGLLVLYYLVPQVYIGRSVFALAMLLSFVGVTSVRWLSRRVLGADSFKRRVLVYGAGNNADLINSSLRRSSDRQSFVVVGFVPVDGQPVAVPSGSCVADGQALPELVQSLRIDDLVVALDERRGSLPMDQMLACVQRGVSICDLSTFFEREAGMVKLKVADPSWLAFSGGFDHSLPRRLSKRFFDVLAASALLLVAWPAMLLVAVAIRWDAPGPIRSRQTRVGGHGQPFELIKFRSMRVDAEGDGVARWASKQDDRSTRVGRFIRQTRLDELPQLFNVLRGQMSFVGPRPERPNFVDMLCREVRYYDVRHCVKPGLTGWAQLRYPYGASVRDAEEKLTFDLFYVKNQGLLLDMLILLQTVEVVLFRRGGR